MGYAALADLYNVMPPTQMGQVTTAQQQSALDYRSAYADAKMRARYALPLVAPYDPALVRAVCELAAWDIIQLRGYNPQNGADLNFRIRAIGVDGRGGAQKLLDDVERQSAHFNVVEAIAPSPAYAAPLVVSGPLLGFMPYQGQPNNAGPPLPGQTNGGQAGNGTYGGGSVGGHWPDGSNPPPGVF